MQANKNAPPFESHRRSILFIQTDLLSYLPEVGLKPAGLQWEDKIVACNEVARSYGVVEQLPVTTALNLCPDLFILNSEVMVQLTDMVNQIDSVLQSCSLPLERINLNGCFLEVTGHPLVANAESCPGRRLFDTSCMCGCLERLTAARNVAFQLLMDVSFTIPVRFRIGIASSKLLARLAAFQAKDDECHAIAPEDALDFLQFQDNRLILPGSLGQLLVCNGWKTAGDIRTLTMKDLSDIVGVENATEVMRLAYGEDRAQVVPSDMWQLFCLEFQIWEKYSILLHRLLAQVEDVGCVPLTVRVSVRKQDPLRGTQGSKESKSAIIPGGTIVANRRMSRDHLCQFMGVIMSLFRRIVDTSRPFQLSLLGLAFDRFHHDPNTRARYPTVGHHSRTVASCLMRKREYSVEVPFSAKFEGETRLGPCPLPIQPQPELPDLDLTPRKKKAKLDVLIHTKKYSDEDMDLCSLSKLRVADLKLTDDLGKLLKC